MEYYIKSLSYSSNLKEDKQEPSLKANAIFDKTLEVTSGKEDF